MGEQKAGSALLPGLDQPGKRWHPDFSMNRRRDRQVGDRLFKEALEKIEMERGLLEAFLRDVETSGPAFKAIQVRKFFRNSDRGLDAKIWMDFRVESNQDQYTHPNWLTSNDMARILEKLRSHSASSLNTIRQLTFVPILTPKAIEDLVITATRNEIDALRPAVCQHIAGETLIRVEIPAEGFSTFKLILNLPYLVLEETEQDPADPKLLPNGQIRKQWADLSDLPLESDNGEISNRFAIYKSQITVVISGYDDSKWFGYAFGSVGPDDPTPDKDDGTCADQEEEDFVPEPVEDLFATGGSDTFFGLENPIWDPRVYFLKVVRIRLDIAVQAYEYLVRTIEAGVKDWTRGVNNHDSNKKALEKIIYLTLLLQDLKGHFSQAISAWENFDGTGDALYFADLRSHQVAYQALSGIEKAFETIVDLQRTLTQMENRCRASTTILQLRMTDENNRMTQENNRLTSESIVLIRRTTGINLITSRHSEEAAASAAESSRSAEETSRSTRINVQLFLFGTVLMIVLQYFCSERALFPFERTQRAFWISIAVLMPSFTLLSTILYRFDRLRESILSQLIGTRRKDATLKVP